MPVKIRILYYMLFIFLLIRIQAQELTSVQEQYISRVMETLAEEYDNSEDISVVFDDLLNYLQSPLNLNSATADELAELHVLSAFQIAVLIDYRKTQGNLLSIYELLYIPGYRKQDIDLISPFVTCEIPEEQDAGLKGLNSRVKQQAIVRYQRILEQQKGYIPLCDSIMAVDPDKARYLGSPDKLYFRYKIDFSGKLQAGFLTEKDAGEEFFSGSNRYGFDFNSGYIQYKNNQGIFRQFTLGDYHIRMGQGLLVWSSYTYGKSSYISDLSRRNKIIKANTSAEENLFFRGSALSMRKGNVSFTAFASMNYVDASVESDTSLQDGYITGFTATGYHATPSDLKRENNTCLTSFGASLLYSDNHLKLGLNSIHTETDKIMADQDAIYKVFYYSGRRNTGISLDYQYLAKKAQFFGEAAFSNGAFAVLNGMLIYLKPELNLGILHRHYDKKYYSLWADAFREGSQVANEDGFFIGLESSYWGNRFRIYSDIFSFPWLRYRVNSPSEGYELFGEWERTIGEAIVYIRYKRQEKPLNQLIENNLYKVSPEIKEQYRIHSTVPVGSFVVIQNRLELSRAGFRGDTLKTGFLVYQDILLRSLPVPVYISLRLAYFNAEDYDTRIYAYERDILYAATSQMHYRKGWRYMLLLKWQPIEKLSFWFKIGQTRYPGVDTISSGLTEIEGNHRTELKVQMIVNL